MSTLDLSAIGNFQSASLTHQVLKHVEHGKDAVAFKAGLIKSPLRVTGTDPLVPLALTPLIQPSLRLAHYVFSFIDASMSRASRSSPFCQMH